MWWGHASTHTWHINRLNLRIHRFLQELHRGQFWTILILCKFTVYNCDNRKQTFVLCILSKNETFISVTVTRTTDDWESFSSIYHPTCLIINRTNRNALVCAVHTNRDIFFVSLCTWGPTVSRIADVCAADVCAADWKIYLLCNRILLTMYVLSSICMVYAHWLPDTEQYEPHEWCML